MEIEPEKLGKFLLSLSEFGVTEFEKNFDPEPYLHFASVNYQIPCTAIVLYLTFCFGVRELMKDKDPYGLELLLAGWNAFLSTFSFLGMCRTVPYLLSRILTQPYEVTVCENPRLSWGKGSVGLWVMLFIFSKIPELIDTVFIVIRKKPLIFLHWYHHVTVLFFCWNAYATLAGTGLYFVAMNYSVHALMYGYYCLSALHMVPKGFPTILITMSQIAQMFVGTGVCMSAWWYWHSGHVCHNDITNLICGGLMYGSYLYLFMAFALKRYSKKPKTLEVATTAKATATATATATDDDKAKK